MEAQEPTTYSASGLSQNHSRHRRPANKQEAKEQEFVARSYQARRMQFCRVLLHSSDSRVCLACEKNLMAVHDCLIASEFSDLDDQTLGAFTVAGHSRGGVLESSYW
ncbi:hypothetical protein MUK42_00652 [Musa troglodytarum]|uniref:Uncharacterized protein n=1 Tax=Musa troglodytarum TaxID=320322 RepID=A0A9E7FDB6_9LILI|nr:hypothetical protein MUK42_00652 [Musa troglodytarum]